MVNCSPCKTSSEPPKRWDTLSKGRYLTGCLSTTQIDIRRGSPKVNGVIMAIRLTEGPSVTVGVAGAFSQGVTVLTVSVDGDLFLKMDEACRSTRDLIAKNPIQEDLWDGYIAARAWPFVTALYSGIEQALKMLLLTPTDSSLTLDELRKRPYGHDLQRLHAELSPEDKEHIEMHFGEHWSLFEFGQLRLGFDTAERFIFHINGSGNGRGHTSWRYTLVDPSVRIPPTRLWTMWEIWEAVCCCIRARMSERSGACSRLSKRLTTQIQDLIPVESPYESFSDDLIRWRAHKDSSVLAAWLELLVQASRGDTDQIEAPPRLRPELAAMANRAIELMSNESANPDEEQLLRRIRRTDLDLIWKPRSNEFGWASGVTPIS